MSQPAAPAIPARELSRWSFLLLLLAPLCCLTGCAEQEPDLVIYCSLDEVFAREQIAHFEAQSGLKVRAEFDIEANKTVGLVRRLMEERSSPRCDVFWNNEIAQTIRLAEEGLLEPYVSPSAAEIPVAYKSNAGLWTGFAARARILIVNTQQADPKELSGMSDLLDPRWKSKASIARPLTGTTLTHATALYQVLGEDDARKLFTDIAARGLRGDLNLANSNGQVMGLVSAGTLAWGWTDTDDYNVARMKGAPVSAVWPDQEGIGTLLIPNTVSLQKGAPHLANAKRFIDWVLSAEVERALAFADSAQIPLRDSVERPAHVPKLGDFKAMQVDYVKLGQAIANRTEELKGIFLQ